MGKAAASTGESNYLTRLKKEIRELRNNVIQFEKKAAELEINNQKLETKVQNLKTENQNLETNNQKLETKTSQLEKQNQLLEEKLKLALYRQFSRHVERYSGEGQPLLFESAEQAAPAPAESTEIKAHTRRKRGRKKLDEKIPRVDTYIDIQPQDKQCACGKEMTYIGEDIRERLHFKPAEVYVEKLHIRKYACHNCEGSGDEERKAVRTGKIPGNILPGSVATAGLLSFIFTQKYCDYVPYYRQEGAFRRIGVELSRQNMSNWQQGICAKVKPLLKVLKEQVRAGPVVQMDETEMQVMDEPGRENRQKSYMWLARGGLKEQPVVWYEYHPGRESRHIIELLAGYRGYLQTDGYEAYETAVKELPGIIHIGCFAHARRYFHEAAQVGPSAKAEAALSQIQGLYKHEKALREELRTNRISAEEFIERRRECCQPILDAFKGWLDRYSGKILESSKLGAAVEYTLGQWPKLVHYLDHEELTPDNNACERSIRPFVMSRKNWVLSGSPTGAASSCQLFSLIETAKANGKNPYRYLKTVFERAGDMTLDDDWSQLLPWNLTF